MPSLSDIIEAYLKELLDGLQGGPVELQRGELAQRFACAPSQINYVLETRFTTARGYLVESRRGGGGFIRLRRLVVGSMAEVLALIDESLSAPASQERAQGLLDRLLDAGILTPREHAVMTAAVHRETLLIDLPGRDILRASLLKAMLLAVLRA